MKFFCLFSFFSFLCLSPLPAQDQLDQSYLPFVLETEQWISNAAFEVNGGQSWLFCPDSLHLKDQSQPINIYQGSSGVVLFYLELFSATGDEQYLTEAKKGAEHLISVLPDTIPSAWDVGFYTGMAGLSYTLEQVYRMSDQKRYRKYALKYLDLIKKAAAKTENGIEWGGINDIVYGSAGIGLYLLYASEEMGYKRYKRLAVKAGRGLLDNKTREGGAVYWGMAPGVSNNMPNFSHGTAGVCYFLLRLYEVSGKKEFFEAAMQGVSYLEKITNENGLIHHSTPANPDIYYLSWCHGPAGTARLYYKLYEITEDKKWMDKLHKASNFTMSCGIPEKQTPGFWNNVSICCGSAGLAQYFLEIYRETDKKKYLEFSKLMTEDLIRRSELTASGRRWVQAEHRVQPENLMAQTGYMQGAAGIGIWLMKLEAFRDNRQPAIRFPDNPFE